MDAVALSFVAGFFDGDFAAAGRFVGESFGSLFAAAGRFIGVFGTTFIGEPFGAAAGFFLILSSGLEIREFTGRSSSSMVLNSTTTLGEQAF